MTTPYRDRGCALCGLPAPPRSRKAMDDPGWQSFLCGQCTVEAIDTSHKLLLALEGKKASTSSWAPLLAACLLCVVPLGSLCLRLSRGAPSSSNAQAAVSNLPPHSKARAHSMPFASERKPEEPLPWPPVLVRATEGMTRPIDVFGRAERIPSQAVPLSLGVVTVGPASWSAEQFIALNVRPVFQGDGGAPIGLRLLGPRPAGSFLREGDILTAVNGVSVFADRADAPTGMAPSLGWAAAFDFLPDRAVTVELLRGSERVVLLLRFQPEEPVFHSTGQYLVRPAH